MSDSSQLRLRSRNCLFVLYPESQQDVIDYCQKNFPCAWALHDKDVYTQAAYDACVSSGVTPEWQPGDLKKPHMHFVCQFPNARYFTGIAKEMNVPVNTIRRCNNLYKAYVYLWHELNPEKAQYDKSIVGSHEFNEPSEHYGMSADEDEQLKAMFNAPHFDSYAEMARWSYEEGCWAVFKKNYSLWRDIFQECKRRSPARPVKRLDGFIELSDSVSDPF